LVSGKGISYQNPLLLVNFMLSKPVSIKSSMFKPKKDSLKGIMLGFPGACISGSMATMKNGCGHR
jgi:hypothetical protein